MLIRSVVVVSYNNLAITTECITLRGCSFFI